MCAAVRSVPHCHGHSGRLGIKNNGFASYFTEGPPAKNMRCPLSQFHTEHKNTVPHCLLRASQSSIGGHSTAAAFTPSCFLPVIPLSFVIFFSFSQQALSFTLVVSRLWDRFSSQQRRRRRMSAGPPWPPAVITVMSLMPAYVSCQSVKSV